MLSPGLQELSKEVEDGFAISSLLYASNPSSVWIHYSSIDLSFTRFISTSSVHFWKSVNLHE